MKKKLFVTMMVMVMAVSTVACGNEAVNGNVETVQADKSGVSEEVVVTVEPTEEVEEIVVAAAPATPEPTEEPEVITTSEPTEEPEVIATPEPTVKPVVTEAPEEPVATPEPIVEEPATTPEPIVEKPVATPEPVAQSGMDADGDGWVSCDEYLASYGWAEEDLTDEQFDRMLVEVAYVDLDTTIRESEAKGLKETDKGYYGNVDYGYSPLYEKYYGCNVEAEYNRLIELYETDSTLLPDVEYLMTVYFNGFSSVEEYEKYVRITGDDGCNCVDAYWQLVSEGVIK